MLDEVVRWGGEGVWENLTNLENYTIVSCCMVIRCRAMRGDFTKAL
jgi:hypothetical protein